MVAGAANEEIAGEAGEDLAFCAANSSSVNIPAALRPWDDGARMVTAGPMTTCG